MSKRWAKVQLRDAAAHVVGEGPIALSHAAAFLGGAVVWPVWVVGAGSVLDLAGSGLRFPEPGSLQDDAASLKGDFYKVGRDLHDVFEAESRFD